jgi:hypothetical protein
LFARDSQSTQIDATLAALRAVLLEE